MEIIQKEVRPQPALPSIFLGLTNGALLLVISQTHAQGPMKMVCIALGSVNLLIAIGLLILRTHQPPR